MARRFRKLRKDASAHRKRLFLDQGGLCHWCKKPMALNVPVTPYNPHMCTVDHVIALADGGSSYLHNLVAACQRCNVKRGSQSQREHNLRNSRRMKRKQASVDDRPSGD